MTADDRVRFIEHRGARILLADYSHLTDTAALVDIIRRTGQVVQAQPPDSVLGLTDTTGCVHSLAALTELRTLMRANRPFVRAAATVITRPELRVTLDALLALTRREVAVFATREDAMEWLADRAG